MFSFYTIIKECAAAAPAAATAEAAAANNSINKTKKDTTDVDLQSKYFNIQKFKNDDELNKLGQVLGYFAFSVPRVHKDGLSLEINFSTFTLLMLFNYFELCFGSKLSDVLSKIIKLKNVNKYLDIPYDENDLPISFTKIKTERQERQEIQNNQEFISLDNELLKFVGILLCIREIDEPETTLEILEQQINGEYVNHPYNILMNLLIPFLYQNTDVSSKLMTMQTNDHPSPYYLIEDMILKLRNIELISNAFIQYGNTVGFTYLLSDNRFIDIETLGQCISENSLITRESLLNIIQYTGVKNIQAQSVFETFINSLNKIGILKFIKYVSGSIKLPNKIIINFINNPISNTQLNAHTCFYSLDINIEVLNTEELMFSALSSVIENIEKETVYSTSGGGYSKKQKNRKNKSKYSKKQKNRKNNSKYSKKI